MSNLPDFTNYGYQVIRELGYNSQGGRTTYLAKHLQTQQEVVIKAFCFMQDNSDWTGYQAHEREIKVLKELNHPRIPRYLDSFPTNNGFCLVQEYKNAPSLAEKSDFTPEDVKKIALSVLEILVKLQARQKPVFHRDIKPDNILVDAALNAYLIDFGFARIDHNNSMAASSFMGGTLGFMPFEQIYEGEEYKVNQSSDLYSLGMTLICLLTQTKSANVSQLITPNGVNFEKKLPTLHPQFIKWLNKMVASDIKNRFPDAKSALNELKAIRVEGLSFAEKIGNNKKLPVIPLVVIVSIVGGILANHSVEQKRLEAARIAETQRVEAERIAEEQQILEAKKRAEEKRQKQKIKRKKKRRKAKQEQRDANQKRLFFTKNCPNCDLERVDLSKTDLKGANLKGANLQRANLQRANLQEANLEEANLQGANLQEANLEEANLQGSNLYGLNARNTDFTGTTMPDGTVYEEWLKRQ